MCKCYENAITPTSCQRPEGDRGRFDGSAEGHHSMATSTSAMRNIHVDHILFALYPEVDPSLSIGPFLTHNTQRPGLQTCSNRVLSIQYVLHTRSVIHLSCLAPQSLHSASSPGSSRTTRNHVPGPPASRQKYTREARPRQLGRTKAPRSPGEGGTKQV